MSSPNLIQPAHLTNALPSLDALAVALRALVAAGASNELLGQVTRELVGHLPSASGIPQPDRVPGASLDENRQRYSEEQARAAPGPAIAGTGERIAPAQPGGLPARQPAQRPVIVDFKENGERSSVSIPAREWSQMLEIQPDAGELRALVRATALDGRPPVGSPRSAWVLAKVKERLRES